MQPVTEDKAFCHMTSFPLPCLYCASVTDRQMCWTTCVADFMTMGDKVTTTELLKVQFPSLKEL